MFGARQGMHLLRRVSHEDHECLGYRVSKDRPEQLNETLSQNNKYEEGHSCHADHFSE